jgi:hypothetical protein
MDVVLQDRSTNLFLSPNGSWNSDRQAAWIFPNATSAIQKAGEMMNFPNLQLVMQLPGILSEIRMPIGRNTSTERLFNQ